jgi:hypothetical protein
MINADVPKDEPIHGFKLTRVRFVKEINADVYQFEHVKSGAKALKIDSTDPNKTFSIAFKTVPDSDCGLAHIMEHSVLNGSENFPVKSPFDVLIKGSLNTFLNAMTGSDLTIYPVASMNEKDYFNLMHVYLDAVFYPLVLKDSRILAQEGWHYELENPESPLEYKGVVYNEMKGAYSNPMRELGYQIDRALFPNTPYRFSSGGYPSAIPELTFEKFKAFHQTYYHPENSYIFLYGDADLNSELEFIDTYYLSHFTRTGQVIFIPEQAPFDSRREKRAFYPVSNKADEQNQTYLTMSWVIGQNTDRFLVMMLDTLAEVLVNHESAPLRLALEKANIGRDVSASVDELKQNVFQVVVNNANPEDKDRFQRVVTTTLLSTIENGLDKDTLEGTLNRKEFRLREQNNAQKGLVYNFQTLSGWVFKDDPYLGLEWEKSLEKLRTALHTDLLEKTVEREFLKNNHCLVLTLAPKAGMEQENNTKIREELRTYKDSLSPQNIESLVKKTRELIEYQKQQDSKEALASIPMLSRSDIDPKAQWYELQEMERQGIKVLHFQDFTHNVVYVQLLFNMKHIPQELLPYAGLLSECLGVMSTKHYTYGALDNALNIHTGALNTGLTSFLENRDDTRLLPQFVISGKALTSKVGKLFQLVNEILFHSLIDDTKRLKQVVTRHQARLEARIKSDGLHVAMSRADSYFSQQGKFEELVEGLDYYWFISALVGDFERRSPEIVSHLIKTAELLFQKNNLVAAVTCESDDYEIFESGLDTLAGQLKSDRVHPQSWDLVSKTSNEGILTPSKVQFVVLGCDFKKLGYEWSGKMRVLNQVLSREWLQNQIRIIGGAYGGFSVISPTGRFLFLSYRDPNLIDTLNSYKQTPDYLKAFDANEDEMTRFIIGTIARIDRPLTVSEKGKHAIRNYFENVAANDLQEERDNILNTTREDIQRMVHLVSEVLHENFYCVYGNKELLQSEAHLFNRLIEIE